MNDAEIRSVLQEFDQYIRRRHNANIGWWNDPYAWQMSEDVIKPALAKLDKRCPQENER